MSELIHTHDNRATIRWKLLTGTSALALMLATTSAANAEDTDRPQIWIGLGGQMDMMQGYFKPFTASFMSATPTPGPYRGNIFDQKPSQIAFDTEGKISFQPEDSDWIFSAGIRYGRSHSKRHTHHQTATPTWTAIKYNALLPYYYPSQGITRPVSNTIYNSAFADVNAPSSESHAIIDFQAGKDLGLGLLGSNGSSEVSIGVRIAQFRSHASVEILARPSVDVETVYRTFFYGFIRSPYPTFNFHDYKLKGEASRSFEGVGPSLSWNGSAAIAGNAENGELTIDFGLSGAVLFGRQKSKTSHQTQAHYLQQNGNHRYYTGTTSPLYHSTRSRRVTVPELSGFIGLSARYQALKLSLGYKGDIWFKAIDRGIDAAKKSNLTFNGPYASISIGLGD